MLRGLTELVPPFITAATTAAAISTGSTIFLLTLLIVLISEIQWYQSIQQLTETRSIACLAVMPWRCTACMCGRARRGYCNPDPPLSSTLIAALAGNVTTRFVNELESFIPCS
jgi:hypothetical protein